MYGGRTMPFSVITAVMYFASVTSKAGFQVLIPAGAISSAYQSLWISSPFRSSIWISAPVGSRKVDGGGRHVHVERDAVFLRQHGDSGSPDLIGSVTIGGHPVAADYYGVDLALLHGGCSHVVADQGHIYAGLLQFPAGESCSLQERACLVGEYMEVIASFLSQVDGCQAGFRI